MIQTALYVARKALLLASEWAPFPLPRAEEEVLRNTGTEMVEAASRTLSFLFYLLIVLILIPIAFVIYRRFIGELKTAKEEKATRVSSADARKLQQKGDFASAADAYLRLGDTWNAASMFEKARDLARAAELYEEAVDIKKAVEMYTRCGESLKAAELCMKTGEYAEAARIFKNKGDSLRAAHALEMLGNRMDAAKEYSASGQFARAAALIKEEGSYAEAAEAYFNSLRGEGLSPDNMDEYYTYAAYLILAKRNTEAVGIYENIILMEPDYKNAKKNLQSLISPPAEKAERIKARPEVTELEKAPPVPEAEEWASIEVPVPEAEEAPPAPEAEEWASIEVPVPEAEEAPPAPEAEEAPPAPEAEEWESLEAPLEDILFEDTLSREIDSAMQEGLGKEMPLRDMLVSGRMDPKYSMRLWIQIMKGLGLRHQEGTYFGCITPESIFIDMQNNVRIEPPTRRPEEYTAPETALGGAPLEQADIYSMGVILYEMLTGSHHRLGGESPSTLADDVPPWLDALVEKIIHEDVDERFKTLEEISVAILKLKSGSEDIS
jgi:tetratricopeptide (TPR) repeat protein